MSASPAVMHVGGDQGITSGRAEDERIYIPAKWRYGQVFFDSLPDYGFTTRLDDVEKFFNV